MNANRRGRPLALAVGIGLLVALFVARSRAPSEQPLLPAAPVVSESPKEPSEIGASATDGMPQAERESLAIPVALSAVTDVPSPDPRPLVLRGRVLDYETDLPIAGARIRAIESTMEAPVEATSASDGRFEIRELEFAAHEAWPVGVQLRVDAPERASHYSRAEGTAPKHAPLELDAGDIRLRAGTRVTGRVVDAETRAPRAAAALFLFDASEPALRGEGAEARARDFSRSTPSAPAPARWRTSSSCSKRSHRSRASRSTHSATRSPARSST